MTEAPRVTTREKCVPYDSNKWTTSFGEASDLRAFFTDSKNPGVALTMVPSAPSSMLTSQLEHFMYVRYSSLSDLAMRSLNSLTPRDNSNSIPSRGPGSPDDPTEKSCLYLSCSCCVVENFDEDDDWKHLITGNAWPPTGWSTSPVFD